MKQSSTQGREVVIMNARCTGAQTSDRDTIRIPAESSDIFCHPGKCQSLIFQAHISGHDLIVGAQKSLKDETNPSAHFHSAYHSDFLILLPNGPSR